MELYWKRIKEEIHLPKEIEKYNNRIIKDKSSNFIRHIKEVEYNYTNHLVANESYGLGEEFLRLSEDSSNTGFLIDIDSNSPHNKAKIDFHIDKENPTIVDYNLLICRENSNLELVINYDDDREINGFHNGFTKVFIESGAKVNIYKIQSYSKNIKHFDSNIIFVKENAEVNIIDIQLGSKLKGINYDVQLIGDNSICNIKSIYIGTEEDKMDFSYNIKYLGRKTKGFIESKGALTDKAWKVFRSTIDFVKGSKKARGGESEYVTLLSKDVKSHAIPALFCTEDDVIGEHAASAGQIDQNKMFYLMSRGLDQNSAKILVVESSFEPILELLPDKAVKEKISKNVKSALGGSQVEGL